jgi:predicted RNA binding protein YcfA (HicA-like mRNA interferase family)
VEPRPKTLNQKNAIALLQEHGWSHARGGKHAVKMTKAGCRPITLPRHRGRDYGPGLKRAILRQAGLD